ncbi:MAG: hypothetical protein HKN23_05655, partial [Verrucomicrobiales bacterium]|nr:hypothetical protein [Verrucomicrobiales bacterium]
MNVLDAVSPSFIISRGNHAMSDSPKKKPRKFIRFCSWFNLLFLLAILILIFVISERWWLGVIATYAPRMFYLVPGAVLLLAGLFVDRKTAVVSFLGIFIFAFVGLEFSIPGFGSARSEGTQPLRVVTCNVHRFLPDFDSVLEEVGHQKPDLLFLQETRGTIPVSLKAKFKGWNHISSDAYWIGSAYPLRLAGTCETVAFNGRVSAIAAEVGHPDGTFLAINIHPWTARLGIQE